MINYAAKIKRCRKPMFLVQSQLADILECKFITISRL